MNQRATRWLRIAGQMRRELAEDHVTHLAAGIAFYWNLALFPALAAGLAMWALVADPRAVSDTFQTYGGLLPPEAAALVTRQIRSAIESPSSTLTLSAVVGFFTSIWAANAGVKGLVTGVNVAWDLPETRSFAQRTGLAFAFLSLGLIVAGLATAMFAALPALQRIGVGAIAVDSGLSIARWPMLAVVMVLFLSLLYRFAPCRRPPAWRITPGPLLATALFLGISALFSTYVEYATRFTETYGNLSGAVLLLLWLWLSALAVLIGAELDSELEREHMAEGRTGSHRVPSHR